MWYVTVYSNRYHYGVRLDEICQSFITRVEAEEYGLEITKCNPDYEVILSKDNSNKYIVL